MKNGEWIKWVLGILVSISLALSGYHFNVSKALADHMVQNDKDARTRDSLVEEKLVKANIEQSSVNTQILVTLAKMEGKFDTIQQDINYIKQGTTK